jgi:ribosome assembly protein YihI (activator of Der GTPase)
LFYLGAWEVTFEHLSSIRRYSYQALTSSPISSITGKNLTKKPTLTTKARSLGMFSKDFILFYFIILDDLHQMNISSQSFVTNKIDQSKSIDHLSIDEDNDNDDASAYHTRL